MIELIEQHREEIRRIAAKHGATEIRLFGSMARGDARPDSDIDFLVDVVPGTSLLDLSGLSNELRDLLGRSIDLVTEGGLRQGPMNRILTEAVTL